MPSTLPSTDPVAGTSSFGIWITTDGSWSSRLKPPIWKSEKPAGCSVFHRPQPAIFIGW